VVADPLKLTAYELWEGRDDQPKRHTLCGVASEISFDRLYLPLARLVGLGPKQAELRTDGDRLRVKMGWAFSTEIPLSSITNAALSADTVMSKGVHGWKGRWLVNGSSKNLVELKLSPPVPAKINGVKRKLHTLQVSVTDPNGFIREITGAVG
jgi:hypothetical protein